MGSAEVRGRDHLDRGNVLWEWSHDIGGFHGDKIEDELYVRWVQFGAFSPFLRMHSNHGRRLPWEYGEDNAKLAGDAFRMRYRLSHTSTRHTASCAIPRFRRVVRCMFSTRVFGQVAYEFPYEYHYGSELLVAPVFSHTENGASLVPVYLPAGIWHDFTTGRIYDGNKTMVYAAPIESDPGVREGRRNHSHAAGDAVHVSETRRSSYG